MPARKSIMRSLGEFFGHIAHAVRTDPARPDPRGRTVTRQTVEEEQRDTPQGPVRLRRTIIEEVELPPTARPGATPGDPGRPPSTPASPPA